MDYMNYDGLHPNIFFVGCLQTSLNNVVEMNGQTYQALNINPKLSVVLLKSSCEIHATLCKVNISKKSHVKKILLSKQARSNLRVCLYETIAVYPQVDVKVAKKIIVQLYEDTITSVSNVESQQQRVESFFREQVAVPVHMNDQLLIRCNKFDTFDVKIVGVDPNPCGIVTPATKIKFLPQLQQRLDNEFGIKRISYEDIGGFEDILPDIHLQVVCLRHPSLFQTQPKLPRKIIFYGPNNIGQSLIVEAIANETRANLVVIDGKRVVNHPQPNVFLKTSFSEIKNGKKFLIYLKDLHLMAPKKTDHLQKFQLIMQELMELDSQLKSVLLSKVFVMATANAINLDPTFQQVFCQTSKQYTLKSPNQKGRISILRVVAKDFDLSESVLKQIASETKNFNGSQLASLCSEVKSLHKHKPANEKVSLNDFRLARQVLLSEWSSSETSESISILKEQITQGQTLNLTFNNTRNLNYRSSSGILKEFLNSKADNDKFTNKPSSPRILKPPMSPKKKNVCVIELDSD